MIKSKQLIFFGLYTVFTTLALDTQAQPLDDYRFLETLDIGVSPTTLNTPGTDRATAKTKIDLKDAYFLGLHHIPDVLRLVPGYRVGNSQSSSYHGTQSQLPRRNKYLLDGNAALTSSSARLNSDVPALSLYDFASIEVTRGPAIVDYGPGAFLGTVDFISKDPTHDVLPRVDYRISEDDSQNFYASGNHSNRRHDFNYRIMRDKQSVHDNPISDEAKQLTGLMGSSTSKLNQGITANARMIYSEREASELTFPEFLYETNEGKDRFFYFNSYIDQVRPAADYDEKLTFRFGYSNYLLQDKSYLCAESLFFIDETQAFHRQTQLSFKERFDVYEKLLSEKKSADSLNLSTFKEFLSTFDKPLSTLDQSLIEPVFNITNLNQEACGTVHQSFKQKAFEFELGYQYIGSEKLYFTTQVFYRRDDLESQAFIKGTALQNSYNLSSQVSYHWREDWLFNLGGLLEYVDYSSLLEFSPRLAITYKWLPNHAFRFGASLAKRSPSLLESVADWMPSIQFDQNSIPLVNGQSTGTVLSGFINSQSLEPEEIFAKEITYYGKFNRIPITLDFKLFHEEYRQLISDPIFVFSDGLTNSGELTLAGGEFELVYLRDKLKAGVIYSYLDSDTDILEEEALYSRHAGSLYTILDLKDDLHLGVAFFSNSTLSGQAFDRIDITLTQSRHLDSNTHLNLQFNVRWLTNPLSSFQIDFLDNQLKPTSQVINFEGPISWAFNFGVSF